MINNERIRRALLLNQETSELHDFYEEWSDDYDKDVTSENYSAPRIIANLAVALYRNNDGQSSIAAREDCRTLDAGCGTGLAGAALATSGFKHIVGVDLSPNMVTRAEKTGAYKTLCGNIDLTQPISNQIVKASGLAIQNTEQFDMTVCVGVFTLGHVPPSVLLELVNVTRSDGLVLATVREEYGEKHNFREICRQLEASGIANIEHERMDSYVSNDRALYLALRVT